MHYMLGIAVYTCVLAILYVCLTASVIKARHRFKVAIGDGGYADLAYRISAHANFIEHVPLVLVFMLIAIKLGMPLFTFHLMGTTLVLGRVIHAFGVGYCEIKSAANIKYRMLGMLLTFCTYFLMIGYLAYYITAMYFHPIKHG